MALYQIRTTASGELPTDDDLRIVIDEGMPGTTMPGWRDKLNSSERDDVIEYIKSFSRFFEGADPEAISLGGAPRVTEEGLAEGRRLFEDEVQCMRCHGPQGRGDGTSAPELTDDMDMPVRAADLSEPWNFNGGGSTEDIFMRMRTGLDGTPMPSNSDAIDAGIVTEEQLWRVAQYVASLSTDGPSRRRDVIRAAFVETELPSGPDDPRWGELQDSYVPMVGQITVAPRWFVNSVDGVYVKAMHNGERLALHVAWNDPSASPDPAWQPFFEGIVASVNATDAPHVAEQGPDLLVIQFPVTPSDGMELPFFLAGDAKNPVHQIRWRSSPDRIEEGTATGLGTFAAGVGSDVTHSAVFADGRWQVQFTRSLAASDPSVAASFTPGQSTPMAFYVADGTNAEDEVRGAVSAWYAIYLDVPLPPRVFIAPVIATLLTAGLGLIVVARAQRSGN
jgi:DMSO reductase family type II enzyme heme b subunit